MVRGLKKRTFRNYTNPYRKKSGTGKKRVYRSSSKGRKRVIRRGLRMANRAATNQLMKCTQMYAASLIAPYSEESRGACLPMGFPMPSQKNRAYVRGTFNTGTSGHGYILYRPTLCSDQACLTMTGAASVGDAGTSFSAFTNIIADTFAKLPYTTAQLVTNQQVAARFVSGCLRVRYAGTESSRAGLITTLEHPDHLSVDGLSINELGQFESAYRERPNGDGQWTQVNWSGPVQPREVDYINEVNASGISTNTPVLAIGVAGTANGASFEYEAWINVEYIGKITTGKTVNKVDEQGYGNVLQSVKSVSGTKSLDPSSAPSVLSRFGNAIIDNMPQIVGVVGKGIEAFSPGSMLGQAYKSIYGLNPLPQRQSIMYHK